MSPKARPVPGLRPTYQQVHRAAHAVVFALIRHHTPVVQQFLQKAFDQVHEVRHGLGNGQVLGGTLHQAVGRQEGSELGREEAVLG